MNIKELQPTLEALHAQMGKDGCSSNTLATVKWVIGHFAHYCEIRQATEIDMPLIAQFLDECFGIDLYAKQDIICKHALRRPLLILMDYHMNSNYRKVQTFETRKKTPVVFEDVYRSLCDFIGKMECADSSKKKKRWAIASFLIYLEGNDVTELGDVTTGDARKYIVSLENFARATRKNMAIHLRGIFNWMHAQGMIPFSGTEAFPQIRKETRSEILSYYTKDEIRQVLDCVDTKTKYGKTAYFIITITAFFGIRAGDLVNLMFSNIDWENECISIVQQKTGKPAVWPLIDEVKFPLLDYLKNVRHKSEDTDHVLITLKPPYTKYTTSAIYSMVASHIKKSGLATNGRRMGPHALRHSLATGLMNDNVPLSAISGILGHASAQSAEAYLTVDEMHLKELSLEVPNVL